MKKFFFILTALVSFGMPQLASARDITAISSGSINERSILRHGDYFWNDRSDLRGSIKIDVNLNTQMAYVHRGTMLIGVANISSGRDGYETPTGSFTILGKEDNHWSKKYEANMANTMWINNDGVALHSGLTPGRPSSHGCVHLPDGFAKLLYPIVVNTTKVIIIDESPAVKLAFNLFK